MKPKRRRIWLSLAVLLVLAAASLAYYLKPYPPNGEALKAMQGGDGVTLKETGRLIVFEPEGQALQPGVLLYPGALVMPESYAPLAKKLAADGRRAIIVKMPLNLAILGPDRADDYLKGLPGGETYVIGGHSLGGVMASRYAAAHREDRPIAGVFFLASYPDSKGSLAESGLPVLSLLGSNDTVVRMEAYEEGKQYLPAGTVYVTIAGGNHAQFGGYGPQKGDSPAALPAAEQWARTAAEIEKWAAGSR
ncbi:alpha/beta hydrolase [Paenibacillus aurantius]|uniref:Alpha/beta hydrolase n=1 Tax=Paenibacillus aurantius TaxID=2918900 RepID=A0AA96LLL9_9BACL|nr:alpha/beta hydrolase [Paenibacillus aurantius]WNQ14315.1 alpha/beta hydrolase [Paenibacillus aurantius]